MTAPSSLGPGTLLGGRYRLRRLLGEGGMGAVYESVQEDVGREVAVKVIGAAPDEASVRRFQREARAAGALAHPHIVQVFDFEAREGEPPFLVMELLRGHTLAAVVEEEGPLDPTRVARLALQALDALAAAHAVGIVHRDIKPANLFLESTETLGEVLKVVDFGVAKLEATAASSTTAAFVGTLAFMAPEQAASGPVDGRADLFALAASMYFALTGTKPFAGETAAALLRAVLMNERHPVSALRPDLDASLARIVERGLAHDREERYESAAAMASDLRAWLDGQRLAEGPSVTPPRPPSATASRPASATTGPGSTRRRRGPWAAAGVGVVGASLLAFMAAPRSGTQATQRATQGGVASCRVDGPARLPLEGSAYRRRATLRAAPGRLAVASTWQTADRRLAGAVAFPWGSPPPPLAVLVPEAETKHRLATVARMGDDVVAVGTLELLFRGRQPGSRFVATRFAPDGTTRTQLAIGGALVYHLPEDVAAAGSSTSLTVVGIGQPVGPGLEGHPPGATGTEVEVAWRVLAGELRAGVAFRSRRPGGAAGADLRVFGATGRTRGLAVFRVPTASGHDVGAGLYAFFTPADEEPTPPVRLGEPGLLTAVAQRADEGLVVWHDPEAGTPLRSRRCRAGSTEWEPEQLHPVPSSVASLALATFGERIVIAWSDRTGQVRYGSSSVDVASAIATAEPLELAGPVVDLAASRDGVALLHGDQATLLTTLTCPGDRAPSPSR